MLKHSILLALLISWNYFFQEIPADAIYSALVDLSAARRTLLMASALTAGSLLGSAYLFTNCGLYKIAKAFSVLTENGCQFLLLVFGTGQVIFFVALGENLYAATGYLPPVLLFLLLLTTIQAQRIIDFNHPANRPLTSALLVGLLPLLFVFIYALLGLGRP